jgi:hypothetical protein
MSLLRLSLPLAVALLPLAGGAHAALTLTTCGTVVPPGETAALVSDLSCNMTGPSVTLQKSATLDLAGFTLTLSGTDAGIVCADGKCTVRSTVAGGRIVAGGPEPTGFGAVIAHITSGRGKIVVSDLDIEVSPPGSAESGVYAIGNVSIKAANVNVSNALVAAFSAPRIDVNDALLTDNWVGLYGFRLSGERVTTTGGGYGAAGVRARLSEFTAHGAQHNGVQVDRTVVLRSSDVTGNNVGGLGADIVSGRRPRLVDTTCGTSQVFGEPPGTSWVVCQGD